VAFELAGAARALMGQPFEPKGLVTWLPDGRELAVRNAPDG
jgi:hypothetical protein